MLKSLIKAIYEEAQWYFNTLEDCDVCNNTGVLIPRRPHTTGYLVLDANRENRKGTSRHAKILTADFASASSVGEVH